MTQETSLLTEDTVEPVNGRQPATAEATIKTMGNATEPMPVPGSSAADASQRARVATVTFGEIVALLSFSPVFKHMTLGDLEWLVIPALATNQVTVVRGKLKDQNGLMIPIGLAFWAHVSEDVDNKLEAQQNAHMLFRLAPHEWKSGEVPWLLAVLAPKEVSHALVQKLEDTVFKGKSYKRYALTAGPLSDGAELPQSSPAHP